MSKIHFYELSFYHDEDDDIADRNKRCSYAIKTEIPPVISDKVSLEILMSSRNLNNKEEMIRNLTCVQEITEDEAFSFFDMDDLKKRIEGKYGIYYSR